jgi:hypothetical protein
MSSVGNSLLNHVQSSKPRIRSFKLLLCRVQLVNLCKQNNLLSYIRRFDLQQPENMIKHQTRHCNVAYKLGNIGTFKAGRRVPRYEDVWLSGGISPPILNLATRGGECSVHASASLHPGKGSPVPTG